MNGVMLRSIMVLHGDTVRDLAEYLGKTEQSVRKKIAENGSEFHISEVRKIVDRYHLSREQIDLIFFASKVSNLDTLQDDENCVRGE